MQKQKQKQPKASSPQSSPKKKKKQSGIKGIQSPIQKFIQSMDVFGAKVQLRIDNHTSYRSLTGGFCSLTYYFLLFLFIIFELVKMFGTDTYEIYEHTQRRDVSKDLTEYQIQSDKLDFGFYIQYLAPDDSIVSQNIQEDILTYFSFQVHQVVEEAYKDQNGLVKSRVSKYPINIDQCARSRLGSNPETSAEQQNYQLNSTLKKDLISTSLKLWCPTMVDFQLSGSKYAPIYKYIQLKVTDCNQTFLDANYNKAYQCKSKSQIREIQDQIRIFMVTYDSFFDGSTNSMTPVQRTRTIFDGFISRTDLTQRYQILLSYNNAVIEDKWRVTSEIELEFVQAKMQISNFQIAIPTNFNEFTTYIEVDMVLDSEFIKLNRVDFTSLRFMFEIGGFGLSLYYIFYLTVFRLQEAFLYLQLIRNIYSFQYRRMDELQEDMINPKMLYIPHQITSNQRLSQKGLPVTLNFVENGMYRKDRELLLLNFVKEIKKRIKLSDFYIKTSDLIQKLLCKRRFPDQFHQIYEESLIRIEQDLDVIQLIKTIKRVKFLTKTVLTKSQRQLIPLFEDFVVFQKKKGDQKIGTHVENEETIEKTTDPYFIHKALKEIVDQMKTSISHERVYYECSNLKFIDEKQLEKKLAEDEGKKKPSKLSDDEDEENNEEEAKYILEKLKSTNSNKTSSMIIGTYDVKSLYTKQSQKYTEINKVIRESQQDTQFIDIKIDPQQIIKRKEELPLNLKDLEKMQNNNKSHEISFSKNQSVNDPKVAGGTGELLAIPKLDLGKVSKSVCISNTDAKAFEEIKIQIEPLDPNEDLRNFNSQNKLSQVQLSGVEK